MKNNISEELDRIFPCDCSFTHGFAWKPGTLCKGDCVLAGYKEEVASLIRINNIQQRINFLRSYNFTSTADQYHAMNQATSLEESL